MLCKVSLGFLFLLTAVSFLAFMAVAANKTKQPSNNMVSQVAFCEEHACYDTDAHVQRFFIHFVVKFTKWQHKVIVSLNLLVSPKLFLEAKCTLCTIKSQYFLSFGETYLASTKQ